MLSKGIDVSPKEICLEISKRYEIHFLEIEAREDHVHFLIQSVPRYSPTQIAAMVKSITAKEIFRRHPEVKKILWGGKFWSDGYFVNTVIKFGDEQAISKYVNEQGLEKE